MSIELFIYNNISIFWSLREIFLISTRSLIFTLPRQNRDTIIRTLEKGRHACNPSASCTIVNGGAWQNSLAENHCCGFVGADHFPPPSLLFLHISLCPTQSWQPWYGSVQHHLNACLLPVGKSICLVTVDNCSFLLQLLLDDDANCYPQSPKLLSLWISNQIGILSSTWLMVSLSERSALHVNP